MKFGDVFLDSLLYPFKDMKKSLKLFLLFLTSFLIIPGIMACGYLLRIINQSTQSIKELPEVDDWKKLLKDGLKFLALTIIFALLFFAVLEVLNVILINLMGLSGPVIYLMEAIFTILFNMLFIMCLAHMAYTSNFRSGFDFENAYNSMKKVGIKKYIVLVAIFTLFGEIISQLTGFALNNLSINIVAYIALIILSLALYTYLLMFESRFTGLIYYNEDNFENNSKETLNEN